MQKNSKNHHFTVIIPTRERCNTLEHTLRTCVTQDYDNLEIIVSDNFSKDSTREVVESFRDPRVRYVNTGKRLSMTDNFEFALSHVTPKGYVTYIGDDDGLLPNAIHDINGIIIQTGTQVLRWDVPGYRWPDLEGYDANWLYFPPLASGTTERDSATAIQDVLSFKAYSHLSLPTIYLRSAVEYDLIKKIKDLSGRFYHSMTPDVYSGFAIAGAVKSFVNSRRPYAISGCSNNSTGASAGGLSFSTPPAQKFFSENNLPFHSSLVISRSMYGLIIESFLQARDHLPFFQKFKLNIENILFMMMKEAASRTQDVYMEIKDAVLRIAEIHKIPNAAHQAIAANPKKSSGSTRKRALLNFGRVGFLVTRRFIGDLYQGRLSLDCSSLSIKNIYDASLLCDHILRLKEMNVLGFSTVLESSLAHIKKIIILYQSDLFRRIRN